MGYPCQKKTCQDNDPDNDLVPVMDYCSDPELCRPVQGIEVTGGSFPARIWAAYMSRATAGMEVLPFPIPVDRPDEVINSPAPSPSASASPKKTGDASPSPTIGSSPTLGGSPSGEPSPSGGPTILPSPTTEDDREGDP
jgi:membrane peptidoglycan carboxypeptidase